MGNPLLAVKNLSISFEAAQPVVKNVSFEVMPAEMLAVVGESGSGKSVTALSMLQLLPPQARVSGEILFDNGGTAPVNLLQPSNNAVAPVRGKDIAMIFQEPMTSLNPVLTCGNQVAEAIQLHQKTTTKEAIQRTIHLFKKVKLPNPEQLIHRYPHQLSGGQKQRVMIAMAMSCNPALLIADEPTTALDVTVQKSILELLKELQQENGMGVILITHDLGLVADMADRITVMYRGEVIEAGRATTVLQNPSHTYTRSLLLCRPGNYARGVRLPVVGDSYVPKNVIVKPDENVKKEAAIHPALSVEQLKVYYPGRKALFRQRADPYKAVDGVSFTVSNGETLGLVGESGCGKTTLGRAILGLVPVTSGKIILNGQDIVPLNSKQMQPLRKDLQIVFQDPYGSLNPRITIGEAIAEPLLVHGIVAGHKNRKAKVIDLLEKVHLKAEHFNRYPHQFSGGQRQRICIARALALHPSFLIFDESVSALDVSVQAQVLNLLNDLKKEFGFTSIFISHDLSVVRYISDRIMVMQQGKIVEEGPADQVYYHPQNSYTQQLVDAVPGKMLMAGTG